MPFSRKASGEPGRRSEPASSPKGSALLIRFFESEWFDAFIALTYLYKSASPGVVDYLCNRLYTLPERDVERYLSQLTQIAVQRGPGSPLERVIVELCAQSLRIAVKAYWLLLAISQDLPKDGHVAALRDTCEQAALQGTWQLPFKQSRLPPPLTASPAKRPTPTLTSPVSSFTVGRSRSLLSPGGDDGSRPLSPDGLGGGLYSSVFMDTGVEGLMLGDAHHDAGAAQRGEAPPRDLRATRQRVVGSPPGSQGSLLEGPGHPLVPVRTVVAAERLSSLQEELGEGEGVSALVLRSASAGDDGGPGVVRQSEPAAARGTAGSAADAPAAALLSPPNSPRRRQTTFGATLDFVETLCQASSSLTAFQPEDREWALRRALQQINAEIEKASRNGVAIWFPMGDTNLRVVRLSPRESRLLNSREKAPFTLCVEVLDEQEAAAAAEARAAAAAVVEAAALQASKQAAAALPPGVHADPAKSLLVEPPPQTVEDGGAAAAAAEAAAHGIRFLANHHRTISMETVGSSTSSGLEAAALAAVQGSSAATGDAVAAAQRLPRPDSAASSSAAAPNATPNGALVSEPSLAGMLLSSGSPGAAGAASPPPQPRRLTDDLDAVSDEASAGSSRLSSPQGVPAADEADTLLALSSPSSVNFQQRSQDAAQPPRQQQQQLQAVLASDEKLQRQLAALALQSKQPGAGTWIGGGGASPTSTASVAASLSQDGSSSRGSWGSAKRTATMAGDLDAALAGLRGEAPLVSVRLEVLNDRPLSSARSTSSMQSEHLQHQQQQQHQHQAPSTPDSSTAAAAAAAAAAAERRRASLDAARRVSHQCDPSSWACKLGLCKLCTTGLATMGDDLDEPYVRVHLTVQGGVDLTVRKASGRHQRMPSNEAILKVARQHKLPAPELPSPSAGSLTAPQQQQVSTPTQAQQGAAAAQQQQAAAAAPMAACLPMWRTGGSPLSATAAAAAAGGEGERQREEAEAVYGEPWASRKARVQAASPHGRRPGWDLRCVIVKTGDDCRQELLAMQLIRACHEIFAEAQLPLWLRPYEVLPTSNRTALIEMVPNAPSIHAVKSKCAPGTSLRDHLAARHGDAGSPAFLRAQRCFAESLAAYSLVCYLLQIKDRHNGNVLLDDEGHLIHIDFGFMLSNSPGGVNFESAPFKLTRELLEVLDSDSEGRASELFDYFKVLMIQGFLALRKHADRVLLLVEMMQGSGCPCFKSRVAAVQGLKKRFHLALPEPQVVEVVLGLISTSLDAWRTRQYDYYQRVLNGIL